MSELIFTDNDVQSDNSSELLFTSNDVTTPQKSYNVDVKSKKALAENQYEMVKRGIEASKTDRNSPFYGMSEGQKQELLAQAYNKIPSSGSELGGAGAYELLAQVPRLGAEFAAWVPNVVTKAASGYLGGVAGLGQYALSGGDIDKAVQRAETVRKAVATDFQSPLEPSIVAKGLGGLSEYQAKTAKETGTEWTTPLMEASMDTLGLATMGRGYAKKGAAGILNAPVSEAGRVAGEIPGRVAEAVKAVPKYAREKLGDLSVSASPTSQTPAGTVSKKGGFSRTDATQEALNRKQAKAPQVIDNRIINSVREAIPPERADLMDPVATAEKIKIGADNFEQMAQSGELHATDGRGNVLTEADGVTPKPYVVGEGRIMGAVHPVKQMLDSGWSEVEMALDRAGKNGTTIPTEGVAGLEDFNGRAITPSELQGVISEMNDVLHKKHPATLGMDDTIKFNRMRRTRNNLNDILDTAVADALDSSVPSVRELHRQWGGMRTFADAVMNLAEDKLLGPKEGTAATVGSNFENMGAIAGVALTYSHPLLGTALAIPKGISVAKKMYGKYKANPDRVFENIIRARRAQGNVVRERYTDPTQDMPQPQTVYDPSTGTQIPAQQSGSPVSRPPIGPADKQYANPDLTTFEPNMEPQVYPQNLTTPDISTGMQIPARMQGAGGPTEVGGGTPSPLPPDYVGQTSVETNAAPKQKGGKEKTEKGPVSEVKQVPNMGSLSAQLKQAVKDAGGGKKGTAAVAAMVGISVPMLVDFIMGDDDKRKEILGRSKALGGLMMGTFAGVKAKNAPLEMLKKAQAMEAAGIADKQIWSETGWTKGFADKQWRFEIPDNEMKFQQPDIPMMRQLAEMEYSHPISNYAETGDFKHAPLLKSYPALNLTEIGYNKEFGGGKYERAGVGYPEGRIELGYATDQSTLPKTMLHELQHAVQEREGFARGGNVDQSALELIAKEKGFKSVDELRSTITNLEKQVSKIKATPVEQYNIPDGYSIVRLGGEFGGYRGYWGVVEDATGHRLGAVEPAKTKGQVLSEAKQYAKDIAQGRTERQIYELKTTGALDAYDAYRSLAGEAEARLTANRMNLTAAERRAQYPVERFDVPVEKQIIRRK